MNCCINNFNDFYTALLDCGFSMGGGNDEGIFSLSTYFGENVACHTGIPDTDPWEWRMRILEERDGISNGKIFFRKSGWITREWYPYFLAVRRGGESFEEAYQRGTMSNEAKRIYEVISQKNRLAFHEIKALGGFSREEKGKFERALTDLQMRMFITMCGRQQKINRFGEGYGWNSTVFCTVEQFWGNDVIEKAGEITESEAVSKITGQICKLNPAAEEKKIKKFIYGK